MCYVYVKRMLHATVILLAASCGVLGEQPVNVALYKPSAQSSMYASYYALYGNDGSRSFLPNDISCQHTDANNPAWWMVDLRGVYVIQAIVLMNRPDQYSVRLKNFQIDVFLSDPRNIAQFPAISGSLCYNQTTPLANGTYTWNCSSPISGRYVRLIMYNSDYLHMCEFDVMSSSPVKSKVPTTFTATADSVLVQGTTILNRTGGLNSALSCASECSILRDAASCTAFNWFPGPTTSTCQLIKLDPRLTVLDSWFISWPGARFFIESFES